MRLLKGMIIAVMILVVLMAINIICNVNGINLDPVVTGATTPVCAMLLYSGLTKKNSNVSKNKNQ